MRRRGRRGAKLLYVSNVPKKGGKGVSVAHASRRHNFSSSQADFFSFETRHQGSRGSNGASGASVSFQGAEIAD